MPAQSQKPTALIAQPSVTGSFAPARSSIRPPICAATAKPMKNHSSSVAAPIADMPSEIWAYALPNTNTGMNTSAETARTTFSTRNARTRNSRTSMRGDRVRLSTIAKATSRSAPTAMQPSVAGDVQPQLDACCRPSTLRPTPGAISARPR